MTPQEQVLLGPGATPTPLGQTQGIYSPTNYNYSAPYSIPNSSSIGYANIVPNVNTSSVKGTSTKVAPYSPVQNTVSQPTNNNSGSGDSVNQGNLTSKFPGYAGWDINAAWQDYLNTGGSGKGGGVSSSFISPEGQAFASQDEYNRKIDEMYNPQYDYLNQVESNLRPQYQSALEEAQAAFNTQNQGLGTQKETALGQLGQTATTAQQKYESAIQQARSLYDQLQKGYQQRFGGSTSAGGAATEIANVERMKQQGQNFRDLQNITKQVELGKVDVENQYKQNLLQLEQNKVAALNQAKRDFEDKLNQINSQRAQLGANKAAAKLQALTDMRNQVLAIDAQNRQFQQSLELQKQQNQMALDTYAKQLAMSKSQVTSNTANSVNNLSQTPTSNLQATSNLFGFAPTQYVGNIGGIPRWDPVQNKYVFK